VTRACRTLRKGARPKTSRIRRDGSPHRIPLRLAAARLRGAIGQYTLMHARDAARDGAEVILGGLSSRAGSVEQEDWTAGNVAIYRSRNGTSQQGRCACYECHCRGCDYLAELPQDYDYRMHSVESFAGPTRTPERVGLHKGDLGRGGQVSASECLYEHRVIQT